LGLAALWGTAFKWFDWWGGTAYGYRPLVDTMPFLCLLLAPLLNWGHARNKKLFPALLGLLIPSVLVQILGAFTFTSAWDSRPAYAVAHADPERPEILVPSSRAVKHYLALHDDVVRVREVNADFDLHEQRMWSFQENPIYYFLTHFNESRAQRRAAIGQ
jgi:hypothetical protein